MNFSVRFQNLHIFVAIFRETTWWCGSPAMETKTDHLRDPAVHGPAINIDAWRHTHIWDISNDAQHRVQFFDTVPGEEFPSAPVHFGDLLSSIFRSAIAHQIPVARWRPLLNVVSSKVWLSLFLRNIQHWINCAFWSNSGVPSAVAKNGIFLNYSALVAISLFLFGVSVFKWVPAVYSLTIKE